jgi:hypothetical protein
MIRVFSFTNDVQIPSWLLSVKRSPIAAAFFMIFEREALTALCALEFFWTVYGASGSTSYLVIRTARFTVVACEFAERCKGDWISMVAVTLRRETYCTGQTPAR